MAGRQGGQHHGRTDLAGVPEGLPHPPRRRSSSLRRARDRSRARADGPRRCARSGADPESHCRNPRRRPCGRQRRRPAPGSSAPSPRPSTAARPTRSCGLIPSRTSITTPARAVTARPSRARICVRPTRWRRGIGPRKAGSARRRRSNSKRLLQPYESVAPPGHCQLGGVCIFGVRARCRRLAMLWCAMPRQSPRFSPRKGCDWLPLSRLPSSGRKAHACAICPPTAASGRVRIRVRNAAEVLAETRRYSRRVRKLLQNSSYAAV